jgi:hypothetical protein
MSELDGAEFLTAFEAAMRDTALFALRTSQGQVKRKQAELSRGLGVPGGVSLEDMAAIRLAAGQLAEVEASIERVDRCEDGEDLYDSPSLYEEREAELSRFEALREEILAAQPMLRRVAAGRFAALSPEAMLEQLGGDCGQILSDIATTRDNLLAGRLPLWSVQPIVTATTAGLKVSDPDKQALLQDKVRGARKKAAITAVGLAALSIGLGLVYADSDRFDAALRAALAGHVKHYTRGSERNDPRGFFSLPLAALASWAHDCETEITVQSDYLPGWLVRGHFRG